ncbi:hypothetical protein PR048_033545 [Dryococelus australis]|uniref:Uncharacterized protein n=1 Tax=Dryococelus australis TaxID=614101 RepID=A0ABQ9G3E6_9NEOP|nr:hypothetical protein PR048_033545 [Dryococelus australis]
MVNSSALCKIDGATGLITLFMRRPTFTVVRDCRNFPFGRVRQSSRAFHEAVASQFSPRQNILAMARKHCTQVRRLALRGDGALVARVIVDRIAVLQKLRKNMAPCPHSSGVGWPTFSRRVAGSRPGASDTADFQFACGTVNLPAGRPEGRAVSGRLRANPLRLLGRKIMQGYMHRDKEGLGSHGLHFGGMTTSLSVLRDSLNHEEQGKNRQERRKNPCNREMAQRSPDLSVLLCPTDTNVVASHVVVVCQLGGGGGARLRLKYYLLSRSLRLVGKQGAPWSPLKGVAAFGVLFPCKSVIGSLFTRACLVDVDTIPPWNTVCHEQPLATSGIAKSSELARFHCVVGLSAERAKFALLFKQQPAIASLSSLRKGVTKHLGSSQWRNDVDSSVYSAASFSTSRLPPGRSEFDFRAGQLPDFRTRESRQTMPLVGGFSRRSPLPLVHSGAAPYNLTSPSTPHQIIARLDEGAGNVEISGVRLLTSDQVEPGSIPGWVTRGFRVWESCWKIPLVGGFSWGSPVPPPPHLHSGAAPYSPQSPSLALNTPDVKSRPIS